ncbi:hypothetical protein BDP81DRAFT_437353 [Colletotrichum phormii]|uniref:Uncharacterized protein n=1 Tax=Colletotrichum phormii TaxID=359342 RepID=A0AAI9ZIA3_9PEZI|nr:uncharacterized protein BDP81DRAFT_437353 [Colletotrichum phormii]KAK1624763.1 hypothetical protein BDP81DRAFT_437353 [Colletotrichum phormii]
MHCAFTQVTISLTSMFLLHSSTGMLFWLVIRDPRDTTLSSREAYAEISQYSAPPSRKSPGKQSKPRGRGEGATQ